MQMQYNAQEFYLTHHNQVILAHTPHNPLVYLGIGKENIQMYRGNFDIKDYLQERIAPTLQSIVMLNNEYIITFSHNLVINLSLQGSLCTLSFSGDTHIFNRFWLRVQSDTAEKCYGGGEQMSYFNLRGRTFPIWTSEPGVGRDKSTYITWQSDITGMAGGDYYHTNFPQASYLSNRRYYLHIDSTAYAELDFRNEQFHELGVWQIPRAIRIETAPNYIELLAKLTAFLGRQPALPDWVHDGLIVGLQGGSERALTIMERLITHQVPIAAIWCQDWSGKRITSFGKRIHWDWIANEEMYPHLQQTIQQLNQRGIRFLNYINPYLVKDGKLYAQAKEHGYFATKADGSEYLVDFGEFDCGVIDFTNPQAYQWFKEVIQKYSIDLGVSGWMADFGEYLPVDDIKLHNGVSAMLEHNHWPTLWAKCNYDAVTQRDKWSDIFYFMRAGGSGIQSYCPLLWAGDQSVDFTLHDGLATTICAALSAGMSGFGVSHSDIGGYTSLFDNIRTKELYLRWLEMATFTPVMRTHEGNRPDTNFQFYDDEESIIATARLVQIHQLLKPYLQECISLNSSQGLPVQRPLFLHYEHDPLVYDLQYQYLLGADLLVAPVYTTQDYSINLYLPNDEWVHLWSGQTMQVGQITCRAPVGYPAVFYRQSTAYLSTFKAITAQFGGVTP